LDISEGGSAMPVIYDAPVGVGEPHYAVIIKADKLKPWTVYPEIGWDPHEQRPDPRAPQKGKEGVVRDGSTVTVNMTVIRSHFTPEHVVVEEGDTVVWRLTSLETTMDATHGFCI